MPVELRERSIEINGKKTLVLAGEVHYFRIPREEWRHRLSDLRAAGCNTVATYIPWIIHELEDRSFDFTGRTHEMRDVAGFLDLAHSMGLFVIARPGPFIMAELKNEGLPYCLEGLKPDTWKGRRSTTHTLDYSNPKFLSECTRWLDAVLPIIRNRQLDCEGSVIAVQLDNEIGMLSWVSNEPDLTPPALENYDRWLRTHYSQTVIDTRYPAWPATLSEQVGYLQNSSSAPITLDIMLYSRLRFRDYVDFLASSCKSHGITEVPMLINVHGTSAGRGRTYPIGLSQLVGTWWGREDYLCGSDMYLGELGVDNLPDFILGHRFTAALQPKNHPLASLEFECGDSDYGEDKGRQTSSQATALKTHLAIALGNRMLNYYLFAGGVNPIVAHFPRDGNQRIAFTGERHGFAAPLNPEGVKTPGYFAIAETLAKLPPLADAELIESELAIGFIPDAYLTEYIAPGDDVALEIRTDLERYRGMGARDIMGRALCLLDPSLSVVNLSSLKALHDGTLDHSSSLDGVKILALATGKYMPRDVQLKLSAFVRDGGTLLLFGPVPSRDLDNSECNELANALGIRVKREIQEWGDGVGGVLAPDSLTDTRPQQYLISAKPTFGAYAEARVTTAHELETFGDKATSITQLLLESQSGSPLALDVDLGRGRALIWAADYPCELRLHQELLQRLGHSPRIQCLDSQGQVIPGAFALETQSRSHGAYLHLFNVSTESSEFAVYQHGIIRLATVSLPPRSAKIITGHRN